MTSSIAKLADERPKPSAAQEGYVAERHPSMPGLILVWAPCDCVWVGPPDPERPFVTYCGKSTCDFSWESVKLALMAFKAAEESLNKQEATDGIDSVSSNTGGVGGSACDSVQDGPAPKSAEAPTSTAAVEGEAHGIKDSVKGD